ncbi:acyl carrier protein [Nocardia sp. NPDC049190]|uniref:acyl carrier protein n=1 Tax=Nocardia sp. NPDC049190 TaxID=3155650 RepID=UPI0033D40D0C
MTANAVRLRRDRHSDRHRPNGNRRYWHFSTHAAPYSVQAYEEEVLEQTKELPFIEMAQVAAPFTPAVASPPGDHTHAVSPRPRRERNLLGHPMAAPEQWHDGNDRILLRLRAIAGEVLELAAEAIDIGAHFYDDLGVSSLEKAEILSRIEREFGVTLTDGSHTTVNCLGDVSAIVDHSGGARR